MTTLNGFMLAHYFEEHIGDYLRENIEFYPDVQVRDAGAVDDARNPFLSGDGGRDYIIETLREVPAGKSIFGMKLAPNSRYLVEVKFTSSNSITYQRVSGNLSKSQDVFVSNAASRFHGAVLVTNAHLPPSTHWSVCEYLGSFRDGLVIVDGALLLKQHKNKNIDWPSDIPIQPPTTRRLLDDIEIAEGIEELDHIGVVNLFYTFYNRSNQERPIELRLLSNDHWHVADGHGLDRREISRPDIIAAASSGIRPMVLRPWESRTIRLCAVPASGWLDEQSHRSAERAALHECLSRLEIVCASGREIASLHTAAKYKRFVFEPIMAGESHRKEAAHLHQLVAETRRNRGLAFVLLRGKAGVGKSRVIREALKPLAPGSFKVGRCVVEPDGKGNETALTEARRRFVEIYHDHLKPEWEREQLSVEQLLRVVCAPDNRRAITPIFCLEDMHNASDALLEQLENLAKAKEKLGHAVIILSARDDDERFAALDKALGAPDEATPPDDIAGGPQAGRIAVRLHRRTLCELETDAAGEMIRSIILGIDDTSVARILALSKPIPHNIVQCIEHLLDDALVSVVSQATLSITDAVTFAVRLKELPGSMLKLYASRFAKLYDTTHGALAQYVLIAISLMVQTNAEVFGIASAEADWVQERLVERGFLRRPDEAPEQIEWGHESLQLFFLNVLRDHIQALPTKEEQRDAAAAVIERIPLAARQLRACFPAFAKLNALAKGAVAFLSGDGDAARTHFTEMLSEIRALNTFSTADLKTEYYDYIDYAVAMDRASPHPDAELLIRLIPAKAFIGAFNKSLAYAVQADAFGQHVLKIADLSEPQRRWGCFWLDSIIGHVYMDAGRLGAALEKMLELQARLHFIPEYRNDQELIFEIHNCLRLLYTYANFSALSELHGRMADEAAALLRARRVTGRDRNGGGAAGRGVSRDPAAPRTAPLYSLVGMGLGDKALRHFLTNPALCLKLNDESLRLNRADGTLRHVRHAIASVVACQLAARQDDRRWLNARDHDIAKLIDECERCKYLSIIPRLYLLRATLIYLDAVAAERETAAVGNPNTGLAPRFLEALALAKLGLDACTLHVVGYISWQLRNLNAVIAMRHGKVADAVVELETAMELLRKEDLFFMGEDGLVSAVPVVIANYLTVPAITDQRRRARLASIRGFAIYPWKDLGSFAEIRAFAERYRHVARRLATRPPGLIVDQRANMGVVCWF